MHEFRLYIANGNPQTNSTIENLKIFFKEKLKDDFNIEIVDVQEHPDSIKKHDVMVIPTLIRISPPPTRRVIGDLTDKISVLIGLGLQPDNGNRMENG